MAEKPKKTRNLRFYNETTDLEQDDNSWAISYGDMISVLLCFFILLLSISVINPNKFEVMKNNVNNAVLDRTSIEELQQKIDELIRKENLQEMVELQKNELGVDIAIRDKLLFSSGSSAINPQSEFIFRRLLIAFADLPKEYNFQIEGHTDDVPIKNEEFPNNWYLSSRRALSVLDLFLVAGIEDSRLEVQGFADTQPAFPNRNVDGLGIKENRDRNRRVVIKVR